MGPSVSGTRKHIPLLELHRWSLLRQKDEAQAVTGSFLW